MFEGGLELQILDNSDHEAAQIRVRDRFLGPRHLGQYVDLLASVLGGRPSGRNP